MPYFLIQGFNGILFSGSNMMHTRYMANYPSVEKALALIIDETSVLNNLPVRKFFISLMV